MALGTPPEDEGEGASDGSVDGAAQGAKSERASALASRIDAFLAISDDDNAAAKKPSQEAVDAAIDVADLEEVEPSVQVRLPRPALPPIVAPHRPPPTPPRVAIPPPRPPGMPPLGKPPAIPIPRASQPIAVPAVPPK